MAAYRVTCTGTITTVTGPFTGVTVGTAFSYQFDWNTAAAVIPYALPTVCYPGTPPGVGNPLVWLSFDSAHAAAVSFGGYGNARTYAQRSFLSKHVKGTGGNAGPPGDGVAHTARYPYYAATGPGVGDNGDTILLTRAELIHHAPPVPLPSAAQDPPADWDLSHWAVKRFWWVILDPSKGTVTHAVEGDVTAAVVS